MSEADSALPQYNTGRHKARRRLLRCSRKTLAVATWNVRSLVESSGDERICRKRPEAGRGRESRSHGTQTVDRKLDLMVKELRRYRVSVAGIQETKWFGTDVWPADGTPSYTLDDRFQVMQRGLQGMRESELHWMRKPRQRGRKRERHGKLSVPELLLPGLN